MRNTLVAIALIGGWISDIPASVQQSNETPKSPSYSLSEFGCWPRPALKQVLLGLTAVRKELQLTPVQQKAIEDTIRAYSVKLRQARRESPDRNKLLAAGDAIVDECQAAVRKIVPQPQLDRLDQIQLQAQGPFAFDATRYANSVFERFDLPKRLKLTDDQIARTKEIAETGTTEIEQAATVPIVFDAKASAPTLESIRQLVDTPEFKAAKKKGREAAHKAWASVMQRIEQVLSESQRTAYHELLGPPFDLTTLNLDDNDAEEDAAEVARALNIGNQGGGQRSDPSFDTKVARPAHTQEHPRVLFDEAHFNFHTSTGRYKPFAELIVNDGYKVIPNTAKFTKDQLAKGDILVIANALGAEGMGAPGAAKSAFTEAECDAIRDWVRTGGSLLLITDHAPFGSAAESLASRFGVDMSKGYTSDPSNSEGGETSLVFSRDKKLLGDHPITNGRDASERLDRIQTFTGQSLKGPAGSVAILKLGATAVDEGEDGKPKSAAGRAQGLAFAFGNGRVVVMGEAAELSAQLIGNERFGMNVKGIDNRQMALNIMHWLSGLLEPRPGARSK